VRAKTVAILSVFIFFTYMSCSKKSVDEYISIYSDMLKALKEYGVFLENIYSARNISEADIQFALTIQKRIVTISKSVERFSLDYDNDTEVIEKIKPVYKEILFANVYIQNLLWKIKDRNIPGALRLFTLLKTQGNS